MYQTLSSIEKLNVENRNKFVFVIDIDDTLCYAKTFMLGYDIAKPNSKAIEKVNKLYDEGHYIILQTSRGMISNNGNSLEAQRKNKPVLERWLADNNVKYHELVFNKIIADFYVDDRAINVTQFESSDVENYTSGRSGLHVSGYSNFICKNITTSKMQRMVNFEEDKPDNIYTPRIISKLYDVCYIEKIPGVIMADCLTLGNFAYYLSWMVELIESLAEQRCVSNFDYLFDIISSNKVDGINEDKVQKCKRLIQSILPILEQESSIAHMDFTLSNIVFCPYKGGRLVLLDSEYVRKGSSYIFDYAKLYMSLLGYEYLIGISKRDVPVRWISNLTAIISKKHNLDILYAIRCCCYMYITRLYKYNPDKYDAIEELYRRLGI